MYDPNVGRWLTEDPEGFEAGDANLYRYVHNNPVRYVDPTGRAEEDPSVGDSTGATVPDLMRGAIGGTIRASASAQKGGDSGVYLGYSGKSAANVRIWQVLYTTVEVKTSRCGPDLLPVVKSEYVSGIPFQNSVGVHNSSSTPSNPRYVLDHTPGLFTHYSDNPDGSGLSSAGEKWIFDSPTQGERLKPLIKELSNRHPISITLADHFATYFQVDGAKEDFVFAKVSWTASRTAVFHPNPLPRVPKVEMESQEYKIDSIEVGNAAKGPDFALHQKLLNNALIAQLNSPPRVTQPSFIKRLMGY